MRPQAPHRYMNQCHDYKMFIGKGVIHESDDNNYICIGPWEPNKQALPVQFSNDTPRRNQIITRTINTKYSHIPERREQALREEAQNRLIAQQAQKPNESAIGNIETIEEDGYDISDLLSETDLTEEKYALVQGMIAREAGIEPVQVRPRKTNEREAPYTRDHTLQEKLRRQATYGKTKAPQVVRFQDENTHQDDDIPMNPGKEPLEKRVTKILKSPRNRGVSDTLSTLGYSYENTMNKLLEQTSLLPGFTLGEMISLADPLSRKISRKVDKITESYIRML